MPTRQAGRTATVASIDDLNLMDIVSVIWGRWKAIVGGSLLIGGLAFGLSFLIPPQFTAQTTFIPPQSNSGSALSTALSSLGPLAGIAGGAGGTGRSAETYIALLRSRTLGTRLVEQHKLKELYRAEYQFEALDALKSRTRIEYGKREGIITLEFDDTDPDRAAKIANDYVKELKQLTSTMALTEAQSHRSFLEEQLNRSKKSLGDAQAALQRSGFDQSALRTEPRAAAEEYGRIRAELTAIEVQMSTLRSRLADSAPEVKTLAAAGAALKRQLRSLEQSNEGSKNEDYIGLYREYKYQEALHEQLARQFEAARLEESRDENSIQVIDPAVIPEWKSKPKRASIGIAATLIAALLICAFVIVNTLRKIGRTPSAA